jgi:branched-chain amino acid aminotransferase
VSAIHKLLETDEQWVPEEENTALYLRPFMIATEEKLGLKVSEEYLFMVVATPVGPYYNKALRVKVETEFIRAAPGGTGEAKCGGNYGAAFLPTYLANQQGFDQVLWTESENRAYIEESGTMNVLFIIDGKLITPSSKTILDGVTRDSILVMAKQQGMVVEERRISVQELQEAVEKGCKVEAFGAGTAAVVSPIEYIQFGEKGYKLYTDSDAFMYTFRDLLQAIRTGRVKDTHHWNYIIAVR